MALRRIIRFPDPVLRQPTRPVSAIDQRLRQIVEDMMETMYAVDGAGLAAIQVGAPERVFIIDASVAGAARTDLPVVFINPVIEWLSAETETKEEGCLSFPGIFVPVKRSLVARVRALDLNGKEFVAEGRDLYARALQHEHDHLINKLLFDYAGPVKRQVIKRKMERMTDEEAAALVARHGD
ncbi:MAG: peptide deformylase [Myxococcales bacterium]|nr:peptide deformylase [Myxococcota bacterium]MDW8283315.1 peptide deformylase [Myxococcales bacterium]